MAAALALAISGATVCALLGLSIRLYAWWKVPADPRHTLTPAPFTRRGVALRLLREGLLFESLFRASPVTWLLGWPFHVALLLVAVQHLRYLLPSWQAWVEQVAAYGHLASGVMVLGLCGLWLRRVLVRRVRYVSRPSDHLWLLLLLLLTASGVALKYVYPTDVVAVKRFVGGLVQGRLNGLPGNPVLWTHLLLASVLIGVFPFSKMLHGVAVWVNPTRASRARIDDGLA